MRERESCRYQIMDRSRWKSDPHAGRANLVTAKGQTPFDLAAGKADYVMEYTICCVQYALIGMQK
jgi:hypothetical protein